MKGLSVVAAMIFFLSAVSTVTSGNFKIGLLSLSIGTLNLMKTEFKAEFAFLLYFVYAVKTVISPDLDVLIMATSFLYMASAD